MDYIALNIPLSEESLAELLTAELADYPFESFESEPTLLKAYIPQAKLTECRAEIDKLLDHYGVTGRYIHIVSSNWNAPWESSFAPVDVVGRLLIRAPFHTAARPGVMEVVIMPDMSFGTGHHATTHMMSAAVLDLSVAGRCGLDMGSGTGVLSIVAAKCGAEHVDAVDVDDRSDANCRENIAANQLESRITPILGDVGTITGRHYDFILANINRNILLSDLSTYVGVLVSGGELLMSGFLEHDAASVIARASELGLRHVATRLREGWAMVHLHKE